MAGTKGTIDPKGQSGDLLDVVRLLPPARVIEAPGVKKVIEVIGVDRVIQELGIEKVLDALLARLSMEQLQEMLRPRQEQK